MNRIKFKKVNSLVIVWGMFLIFSSSLFLINSCSIKNIQDRWEDMSPKEKSIWMFDVYNDQYGDYMITLGYVKEGNKWIKKNNPTLPNEKRDILRQKKKILTDVYPLIKTYDAISNMGKIPDQEMEVMIINFLEELLLLM